MFPHAPGRSGAGRRRPPGAQEARVTFCLLPLGELPCSFGSTHLKFAEFLALEQASPGWLCSCASGIHLYVLGRFSPMADPASRSTKVLWERAGVGGTFVFLLPEILLTSSQSTSAVSPLRHGPLATLYHPSLKSFVYLMAHLVPERI